MYGDPDTTWGICLELGLSDPQDAAGVSARVGDLCARWPHLGVAPVVTRHAEAGWTTTRGDLAATSYGPSSPLLRVAMTDDGTALLIGAHHGVVDGLGLLAVAAAALGRELRTSARGIGARSAPHGFLGSSVLRLGEALVDPPARFAGIGEAASSREDLTAVTRGRVDRGTADLAAAVLSLYDESAAGARRRRRRVLVIGASRRTVDLPTPDRQTAYLRLRAPSGDSGDLARVIAGLRPEPDFPETSAKGTAPLALRLLRNRLGATAMLSNLGRVSGEGVTSLAMYPASSGPRSVAIGLASTATTTTVSVRTRRTEFDAEEHARLVSGVVDRFFG